MKNQSEVNAYQIYKNLGPIPGDKKIPGAREVRKGVLTALRKKYKK